MVAAKGKAKGKATGNKQVSRSAKAGLSFPVGRIARMLKNGRYSERVGMGAPIYLAAVLEYLVAEILEVSVMVVRQNKKNRIIPRYIFLGLKEDEEFNKLFAHTIITSSPSNHPHCRILPPLFIAGLARGLPGIRLGHGLR
jgi:histone H2A